MRSQAESRPRMWGPRGCQGLQCWRDPSPCWRQFAGRTSVHTRWHLVALATTSEMTREASRRKKVQHHEMLKEGGSWLKSKLPRPCR